MARAPDLRRCRCNLRLRFLRYLRFLSLASMRYPMGHDPCRKGSGETALHGQCIGKWPRAAVICQVSNPEFRGVHTELHREGKQRFAHGGSADVRDFGSEAPIRICSVKLCVHSVKLCACPRALVPGVELIALSYCDRRAISSPQSLARNQSNIALPSSRGYACDRSAISRYVTFAPAAVSARCAVRAIDTGNIQSSAPCTR